MKWDKYNCAEIPMNSPRYAKLKTLCRFFCKSAKITMPDISPGEYVSALLGEAARVMRDYCNLPNALARKSMHDIIDSMFSSHERDEGEPESEG